MSLIVSTQAGNWSSGGTWVGGVAPGNGDSARIAHAVTVDVDTTVGLSDTLLKTMTGTVASSGTTVTGTGTLFTSELKVGDVVAMNTTNVRTVLAIADDTHLTTGISLTLTAGKTIKNNPTSVYVTTAGSLTIASGVTLTVRGNLVVSGSGGLTLSAGAHYVFDSSLASGTPIYSIYVSGGENTTYSSLITASGSGGSRCTFGIAASSGVGRIQMAYGAGGGSIDCAYTDFASIGSSSVDAVGVLPLNSGQKMKFAHCTFTSCGRVTSTTNYDNVNAAADLSFTFNEWVSTPADPQDIILVACYAKTTGLRVMTDNVMALADKDLHVDFGTTSHSGWTIQRNVFSRVDTGGTSAPLTSFDGNFFYIRHIGAGSLWSFIGTGGDTISNSYVVNDEGPAQASQHQVMSNDTPGTTGTWTFSYTVFERTGLPSAPSDLTDVVHPGNATVAWAMLVDHCLVLPMYNGWSSGRIRCRGNANSTIKVTHCTLMIDPSSSGLTNDGGLIAGVTYAGFSGMVADLRDNLGWSKTAAPSGARGGFLGAYSRDQVSPVANLLSASNVDYNAHYNALTGTLYDAAGANGTSAVGYDGWRQTTKPTLTHDVNLGTGSDETVSGPQFVDTSRNLATFDTAYLGNTATAWADATVYAVGDIISAASSGFYSNATINFRCVKAHTSNAANSTNGKPGGTTATSYRTNWEFTSAYRIRQAVLAGTTVTDSSLGLSGAGYISTLHTWVRKGFAPRNAALQNAAHDGVTDIGAVPVVTSAVVARARPLVQQAVARASYY